MSTFYCRTMRHAWFSRDSAQKCCNGHRREVRTHRMAHGHTVTTVKWVEAPDRRPPTMGDLPQEEVKR